MLNNNVTAIEDENKSGYYVTLELYQYREGELIDKRIIENDFILRNLAYKFLMLFAGHENIYVSDTYKVKDITGALRTMNTNAAFFAAAQSGKIVVGTGITPVAVADYKLVTQVLEDKVNDAVVWVNGNQFNVTLDTTIISDGSYSITETGLISHISISGYYYLICRDVFSAIELVNTDVLVIRYIFRFNM